MVSLRDTNGTLSGDEFLQNSTYRSLNIGVFLIHFRMGSQGKF